MKILVINAGSSSLKYQLMDMAGNDNSKVLAKGICERIGMDGSFKHQTAAGREQQSKPVMENHTVAFQQVVAALTTGDLKVINSLSDISAVGHRVVQGGAVFSESILANETVIDQIEELSPLAPLHNPAHVQGLRACAAVMPGVPQVAVFDTAFHQTMPEEAYMFALPYEYYEKYQIRRYGFHGTSHRFVSKKCYEMTGLSRKNSKIITCHLGNGSSIAAILNGKVIDTSMGFTPLDGFMMGTRTGTLDPSVVLFIQEKEGKSAKELSDLFNKKSGVLGISGVSSDERDIDREIKAGNPQAILARKMLCYQITKFIGGYAAALGGVDAIVFTGGIGENNADVREQVAGHMGFLGAELDKARNEATLGGKAGFITTDASKVKMMVIPTNEELVIAQDTKAIIEAL